MKLKVIFLMMNWSTLSSQAANFHLEALVNEADVRYDFHLALATVVHLSDFDTASDRPWVLHITFDYCNRKKQVDSTEHLIGFIHHPSMCAH